MEAVQLFLNITLPGLNNAWNKQTSAALRSLASVETVQIIEENESSNARIDIKYNPGQLPFEDLENTIKASGASITEINIHFPSTLTGIADPYGASAASITIDEMLQKIDGVLNGAISARGEIKVSLNTAKPGKQAAIESIVAGVHSLKNNR